MRDRLVVGACNALLRLATPRYRRFVRGAIEYGMNAAARDEKTGAPIPPDWRS
jgi:hypothetical protein